MSLLQPHSSPGLSFVFWAVMDQHHFTENQSFLRLLSRASNCLCQRKQRNVCLGAEKFIQEFKMRILSSRHSPFTKNWRLGFWPFSITKWDLDNSFWPCHYQKGLPPPRKASQGHKRIPSWGGVTFLWSQSSLLATLQLSTKNKVWDLPCSWCYARSLFEVRFAWPLCQPCEGGRAANIPITEGPGMWHDSHRSQSKFVQPQESKLHSRHSRFSS